MNAPQRRNELVTSFEFRDLRIPYDDSLAEMGIDNVGWKVLQESIFPAAKTATAIAMAVSYCKKRGLDIFKRPVHIVPMWSSLANTTIETVWPSISELRTTAFRTGQYAGCDEAEFGPTIERTFEGTPTRGRDRSPKKAKIKYPEWCRVTVVRTMQGKERRFVGPKVFWLESYARVADTEVPNEMWCKRPFGQIEKNAEAAALRRAFPEEIGNEYTAEEMEGQRLHDEAPQHNQAAIPPPPPPPPSPPASNEPPSETAGDVIDITGREVIDPPEAEIADQERKVVAFENDLASATDEDSAREYLAGIADDMEDMPRALRVRIQNAYEDALVRLDKAAPPAQADAEANDGPPGPTPPPPPQPPSAPDYAARDVELMEQGDPDAELRVAARKRAVKGPEFVKRWSASLSADDLAVVQAMPDWKDLTNG